MKAAIYARVSTDEQAGRDNSIPAQLRALREYCNKSNISIYDEYVDEGITGQKEQRPAFQKMLDAAYKGYVDIILVHKFDRFARKIELSRKIKTSLQNTGVNVISITEPIEDSPMGFFMEGLYELMAEYYVKNLAVEVKKGMNERALKGKHMGQMPYGYYCQGGNVYVHEEQAEIVRKVYSLYLDGWGQLKIAKWLNESMVPTYSGIIGGWQSFQVSCILKNYKYIGKNYWDGTFYDAEFPAILDTELFDKVISIVQYKKEKHTYRGNNFAKYKLLELLFCTECGSPLRIKTNRGWNGEKVDKYICRSASLYRKGCKFSKFFTATTLEADIDDYLKKVIGGTIHDLNIVIDKPIDISDVTNKQLNKINNELSRAKQAYIESVFDLVEYKEMKINLERKRAVVEAEVKKGSSQFSEKEKRKALLKKLKSAWSIYQKVETADEKRKVLKEFIKGIYVSKDKIEVVFFV